VIYRVRHKTTYAYESEVRFARCVLRLTPRSSATQTVLETSLGVSPEPTVAFDRLGPFGELSTTVIIETPHKALVIEAYARVDVHSPPSRLDFADPWEGVRAQTLRAADLGREGPASFIYPSARAPLTPAITDYARSSFPPGRGIIDAATELMGRMRRDFTYDAEATDVSTRPLEAFDARRGVCQDFAHIMICGLRGLGLPARYVSGFLRTYPPPGRPRLEGADATHAWVCLWCGEDTGWIGFDPTNDVLAQDDHIVLASGRDYADVAPIDGIILAPGKQTLDVEVDVVPESELASPRLAFG
jgi:transglutaminase-like putative cysteine protease